VEANAERKAERKAERAERKVAARLPQEVAPVDRRAAMLDILRKDGHATAQDIAEALHITRQAVDGRFKTLEKQGVIEAANGDGWKVLA
jgi:predicted ArsR family transcriptional regulator